MNPGNQLCLRYNRSVSTLLNEYIYIPSSFRSPLDQRQLNGALNCVPKNFYTKSICYNMCDVIISHCLWCHPSQVSACWRESLEAYKSVGGVSLRWEALTRLGSSLCMKWSHVFILGIETLDAKYNYNLSSLWTVSVATWSGAMILFLVRR